MSSLLSRRVVDHHLSPPASDIFALPHRVLWHALSRPWLAGVRFQRRYAIGAHEPDFYCQAAQIAVVIVPALRGAVMSRYERDLRACGVALMDVDARRVLTQLDDVVAQIYDFVVQRLDD
jgi:very-short-patch-repair endonuclease